MNMKDCKRVKPGAMVTEAYAYNPSSTLGMVLHKEYVEEEHYARVLGGRKQARYDLYIQWLKLPKHNRQRHVGVPEKVQCWEVKLLKNAE